METSDIEVKQKGEDTPHGIVLSFGVDHQIRIDVTGTGFSEDELDEFVMGLAELVTGELGG